MKKEKNSEKFDSVTNNYFLFLISVVLIPIFLFANSYISDTMAGPTLDVAKSVQDFSFDLYKVKFVLNYLFYFFYVVNCNINCTNSIQRNSIQV